MNAVSNISVYNMFSLKSLIVFLLLCSVVTSAVNILKSDQSLLSSTTNSTGIINKESALTSQEKHNDIIKNASTQITGVHTSREGVMVSEGGIEVPLMNKNEPSNNVVVAEGGTDVPLSNKNESNNKLSSSPSPKPSLQPDEGSEVSKSSVHARKGVDIMDIPPLINNTVTSQSPVGIIQTNISNQTNIVPLNITSAPVNKTDVTYKVTEPIVPVPEQVSSSTVKSPPQKPTLTVSFDEAHPNSTLFLESSKNEQQHLHSLKNKENSSNNGRDQPAFIIPIVITLFAVPMLGFIGYQAVKRGRDAWKNRHYRRMDFLIDGMYND